MGAYFSKSLQPEELVVFKRLPPDNLLNDIDIPERKENRKTTDKGFLIALVVSLIILVPFLIYTLANSDIRRYLGYDSCGNLCGEVNVKYDQWDCTGKDFTYKKFLQYGDDDTNSVRRYTDDPETSHELFLLSPRKCVDRCKIGYTPVFGTCIQDSSVDNIDDWVTGSGPYLQKMAWRISLACLLSLAVTLIMLLLFRTCTAAMVWGILIGVLVFGAIIVGACWLAYVKNNDDARDQTKGVLLFFSIFFTIILIILFCVLVFLHKKIQLVIVLLKECTKAALAVPQLLLVPIITFIVQAIFSALLVTTTIYMSTSGILTQVTPEYYVYIKNVVMSFTIAFNIVMGLWVLQAIMGIQYMIIAGAISKWYFTKNKVFLDSPLITSTLITFKYHLGSIACGSLVITLVAIIRSFLSALFKNNTLKLCLDYCMKNIEQFLKFLSKNAYILTAMHGEPFFRSGKRAAKIILQNALNVVAINYIGDFIIFMIQLMIVIISELITYAIMQGAEDLSYSWTVYVIVFVISACIAGIFFAMFETIMDTIFLCFCEDTMLNDGMARPYAMTTDLMQFVENSKKVFVKKP